MLLASIALAVSPVQAIATDDDISSSIGAQVENSDAGVDAAIVHVTRPVVQVLPLVTEDVGTEVRTGSLQSPVKSSAVRLAASSSGELSCLAMAVYFEARGEPLSGQKAVADVVMNRKKRRGLSSACAVVNQPGQFSGRARWKPASGPMWERAVAIARDSLSGMTHISSTIQFFHSARISPGWRRKVAMRIGAHVFY